MINTLDQFNINMCNEVLQGEFVRCIFDLEQSLYMEQLGQKIEIDFEDNKDTIQLLKNQKGPATLHAVIATLHAVSTSHLNAASTPAVANCTHSLHSLLRDGSDHA